MRGDLTLESKLISTETAAKEPPSKIGLPIGAEISLELGLRALIIKSANDVAVMLAEAVSGNKDAFIVRMNRHGQAARHDADTLRQPERPARARSGHDGPRSRPAWRPPSSATSRARPLLENPYLRIGKRRLRSHNSLLRTFDGRGRHQDRLHLRFRLQHRGQCHARRTPPGRHRARLTLLPRIAAYAPRACLNTVSDSRLEALLFVNHTRFDAGEHNVERNHQCAQTSARLELRQPCCQATRLTQKPSPKTAPYPQPRAGEKDQAQGRVRRAKAAGHKEARCAELVRPAG